MANIAGSYDQNAEAQGDFSPVPAGDYKAIITESEIEDISRQNAKGRCMKLVWKIDGGEFDGRLIWQRLNLWPENMNNLDKVISIANSQFASIRTATGVPAPQDSEELHHRPCLIRVTVRHDKTGQYPPQNEVKNVLPVGGTAAAPPAPSAPPAQPPANQAPAQGSAPWPPQNSAA